MVVARPAAITRPKARPTLPSATVCERTMSGLREPERKREREREERERARGRESRAYHVGCK
jgi:hypothetical protein